MNFSSNNQNQPTTRLACFFQTLVLATCVFCGTVGCRNQSNATPDPRQPIESSPAQAADKSNNMSVPLDYSIGEGWHTFRGNQQSTAIATGILPSTLEQVWKFEVPNSAFESTPIIVAGNSNSEHGRIYIGDADKYFYAFDLQTGAVDWKFETEYGFVASAAYRDGKIYIGDVDGKFYCLNEDGEEVWQFATTAQIDSGANFHGDLVLFGSRDAKLYALDRNTGAKVWELETADEVRCGITVVDGKAFVAGCDGSMHIIDVVAGKEISSVEMQSPSGTTPSAVGDLVYTGSEQAGVMGIDWKQAKIIWNFDDDEGAISTRSSTAVSGKHVVFGTSHRTVYSVDPATGKQNWATELKSMIETSPVIVGEDVYIGSNDGRLYRLNLSDGQITWSKQLDGGLIGSPAVAFGKLVIATDRGVVYCLGNSNPNK